MEARNSQKNSPILIDELSRRTLCGTLGELYQYQGFWLRRKYLEGVISAQSNFGAQDDDIILSSPVKAGSTWLKALIPCIINSEDTDYDPFIEKHPNNLMAFIEAQLYSQDSIPDLSGILSPRLFRTHISYASLPESIKHSPCKIVYIARNPKDVFVSLWYFLNSKFEYPFNEAFDQFCEGFHPFGPFHDHVLGYWKESIKRPEKVLFLKYEELKIDPKGQVRKLASFLGKSLKDEEIEKVLEKCSLERMKSLEINKKVDPYIGFSYGSYFRKGSVGDWKNHLTEEMKERLDNVTKMKFEGSGLEL